MDARSSGQLLEVRLRPAIDLQTTAAVDLDAPSMAFALDSDEPVSEAQAQEALLLPVTRDGDFWLLRKNDGANEPDAEFFSSIVWLQPGLSSVVQPLFSRRLLDDLGSSLAFNPTLADPLSAHAVLSVEDDAGRPLSGVVAEAAVGIVAYGAGGTASDALEETTDAGIILWLNIATGDVDTRSLALSSEQGEWQARVPVRPGAVTIAALQSP